MLITKSMEEKFLVMLIVTFVSKLMCSLLMYLLCVPIFVHRQTCKTLSYKFAIEFTVRGPNLGQNYKCQGDYNPD